MFTAQTPTRPWEIIATDLFSWNGSNYLLMVNYYSQFIKLAKLSKNKSQVTPKPSLQDMKFQALYEVTMDLSTIQSI